MNLVFVESSSRAWGSEQHFVSLAKGCRVAGCRVVAVVRENTTVAKLLREAGVEVRETPFRGGADPRAMRVVLRAIRDIDANWLITDHQKHYWPLLLIAKLSGTRLAVFRHMSYVKGWLTRIVFPRLADRFFVVSQFALETLVAAGVPRNRMSCLYNPIDLERFRPNEDKRIQMRAKFGLPDDAFLVGFVGRHEDGKGVSPLRHALVLAMDRDPSMHALWLGAGPELPATRAMIGQSSAANRHQFIDWSDSPEEYYAALDCLVAPSTAVETFGRVVVEAQACGVPVIATQVGGLAEAFVAGQTGIALTTIDSMHIAEQIDMVRYGGDRSRWRVNLGKAFVRRFAVEHIATKFLSELAREPTTYERNDQVAVADALNQKII
jgi:glycosyltransferase involved in cell wall biosynthesis